MHRDRVVVVRTPGILNQSSTHTLRVTSRSGFAMAGFRCRDSRLRCRVAPLHSEVGLVLVEQDGAQGLRVDVGVVVLGIHSGDIAHDGPEGIRDERNADALVLLEVAELAGVRSRPQTSRGRSPSRCAARMGSCSRKCRTPPRQAAWPRPCTRSLQPPRPLRCSWLQRLAGGTSNPRGPWPG